MKSNEKPIMKIVISKLSEKLWPIMAIMAIMAIVMKNRQNNVVTNNSKLSSNNEERKWKYCENNGNNMAIWQSTINEKAMKAANNDENDNERKSMKPIWKEEEMKMTMKNLIVIY